jgi:hypothetical protein
VAGVTSVETTVVVSTDAAAAVSEAERSAAADAFASPSSCVRHTTTPATIVTITRAASR